MLLTLPIVPKYCVEADMDGLQWVIDLVEEEAGQDWPDIAKLSIALGLCEQYYTNTKKCSYERQIPAKVVTCLTLDATPSLQRHGGHDDLSMCFQAQSHLLACEDTFDGFVSVVAGRLQSQPGIDARVMPTTCIHRQERFA